MEPFAAAQHPDVAYSGRNGNSQAQIPLHGHPHHTDLNIMNNLQANQAYGHQFPNGSSGGQPRDFDFTDLQINSGLVPPNPNKGGSIPSNLDKFDFQDVQLPNTSSHVNDSQHFGHIGLDVDVNHKSIPPSQQIHYQQQQPQIEKEMRQNMQDVYIDTQHSRNPQSLNDNTASSFTPHGGHQASIPNPQSHDQHRQPQEPYGNAPSSAYRDPSQDIMDPNFQKLDQTNIPSPRNPQSAMNMDPYANSKDAAFRNGGALSPTSIAAYTTQPSQGQKYPNNSQQQYPQQQQQQQQQQKRSQPQSLQGATARRLSVKLQGFSDQSSQVTTPFAESLLPTPVLQEFPGSNAAPPNTQGANVASQQRSQHQLSQQMPQNQSFPQQAPQRYFQQQQQQQQQHQHPQHQHQHPQQRQPPPPPPPSQHIPQQPRFHQYNYDNIPPNMQGSPQASMIGAPIHNTPGSNHPAAYGPSEVRPSNSMASVPHPVHQQHGIYPPPQQPPASEQQQDLRHAMSENPMSEGRDYLMSNEVRKNLSNIAIVRFLRFTDLLTCRHEKPNLPYLRQLITEFFQEDACIHMSMKTATETRSFKISCFLLPALYFKYLEKVQMFEFTQKFLRATVMPNLSATIETDHFSFKSVFEDGSYCNHFGTIRIIMNRNLKFEEVELITDYSVTGIEFTALEKFMNDFTMQNKIGPNFHQIKSHFKCVNSLNKFGLQDDLMRLVQVSDVMTLSKPLLDFFIESGSDSITESFRLFNEMNGRQYENGMSAGIQPFTGVDPKYTTQQQPGPGPGPGPGPYPPSQQMYPGHGSPPLTQPPLHHSQSMMAAVPYSYPDQPDNHRPPQYMNPPPNIVDQQLSQQGQSALSRARSHQNSIASLDKNNNIGRYPDRYDELETSSLSQTAMKKSPNSNSGKPVSQVVSTTSTKKFKLQAPPTPTTLKKRKTEEHIPVIR